MNNKNIMKCILCNNPSLFRIYQNKIGFVEECDKCQLGITYKKNNKYNKNLYDLNKYKSRIHYYNNRYFHIINLILKYHKSGNLLDVGSGFGYFSYLCSKKTIFNIFSIEPNLKLILINKRINFIKKKYQNFIKDNKYKFNIICFLDVFEHLSNPSKILNQTKQMLNKNGIIIFQLPNYQSIMAKVCFNWSWWMLEEHKYHFSYKSINNILNKSGYNIVYHESYESFYEFYKNINSTFLLIKITLFRKIIKLFFFVIFIPIYLIFRSMFWKLNKGGLLLVIAKKI